MLALCFILTEISINLFYEFNIGIKIFYIITPLTLNLCSGFFHRVLSIGFTKGSVSFRDIVSGSNVQYISGLAFSLRALWLASCTDMSILQKLITQYGFPKGNL